MKLSIIIPVYNTEKYLHRCVDSVLQQNMSDYELILIDDGSTDGSGKICDEYKEKDSRVKVIHTQNQGVSKARNTGLELSSGEYIGFVDADDYIDADMYEKLIEASIDSNADVCCCGYLQELSEIEIYTKKVSEKVVLTSREDLFNRYLSQNSYNGFGDGNWNKIFKKSIISDTRYNGMKYGEDISFQFDVFKKADIICLIPDAYYHYMVNEESATKKRYRSEYLGVLQLVDDILEYVKTQMPNCLLSAYAFHLAWNIDVLQYVYKWQNRNDRKHTVKTIQNTVKKNFKYYRANSYSKRRDQLLMYSVLLNCTGFVLKFLKKYN